ncbi:MAG: phage tail tape measure protein, partial [Candidatus Caldarchaeum sp.]
MEIAKAFVSVGANVSQLESALDKVKKELSGFTEEAAAKAEGGGTSAFAGLGKQLAGALLTGWAAMKVKDVIMGQLEEIGKAANIQARLNVQLGGLDEANKAMQSLRTLSIDTGNSLSTLTETFLSMSKAGQSAQEALDFTKQAATLARISGDLAATAQIADNLNNIMGAYGQELGNVANLSDKLAVASTKTQGALEGLTQNLQLAAPVAKDVNVTFDQLVAVLSTVMNAGMESGRAVTSLLGVFTELQQLKLTELPKKWEEVLASLGDGAKAAVESFKQGEISALELIQRLGEAGAGATEFAHLFGNMGARVATIVKDDLLAANSSIADTERALKNASGAAQRAADTMANTLPAAWERIKNTFLNLFTGPEMQEAFAPITNVINTLADSLATLAKGGIPNIVVELFGSEDGAKQFMETMRQLAGEVMSSVGTVFKELWEVLKHIVPVIADLFSLLRDLGVFQAFRVAIEAISKSIQVIVDIIGALVKVLRGDWAGAWEVAGKALQGVFGIFDKVISFIQTIGEGIQRVIEGIFGVQRATRSEAAATAEEEKQMVVTQQLQASLEKLPERIHQAIKEFPDIAKKLDESKALQAMMQFIEVEYRKGTARATDIGAALYDALRAAGLTDLAEKLAKTFAASPLKGKQKGGLVEGTGRGDVVRTALEPGEFVITRAAVRKYGVNFLEAINSGQFSVGAGLGKLLMEVGADIISTYGARFQTGGMVPGTGSGDRVPALLEPGEFVLRKDAVRALGLSTVEALNRAGAMRFQTGGLVPPISGLSVADVAGIVERTGQWWVPYRLMSAELTQTLLKKNPALFRENLLKALVWGIMHVQERVATAERMFETFFGGRVPTTQEIAKALGMSREALLQKVRSPMPDAEAKAFAERVRALYPNFPKKLGTTKVPGIIGAIGLVEDLNLEEFMSKDVAGKMQMIMDNVKGLGPAKSSFALASLGIDDIATLDTWMQKTVLKPALERIASLPDEELAKLGYTRAEALKKISDIERKGQTSWKGVSDYLRDVRAAFGDIATSGTKQWEAYWNILEGGKLQSASVSFRQSSHLPFFKELGISKEAAAQKYAIDVGKADSALMRSLASGTLPLNLSIGGLGLIGDRVGTSLGDMISILSDFDRVYQIRLGQSIQGLEDIVTRHLEYATIYGGRNGQIIEVFGSAADEAKIRTLASELAQKSDVALSIIDKAGGRSTHYLRGQVFAGGAGFAEAPGSAIRLYTQ